MEHLTKETFIEKIFDYENNKEWAYKGALPCVIDFYADWCGPCKTLAPIMEELDKQFAGKVNFYKVDTEVEHELAQVFAIRSIPSILMVPMGKAPQMSAGAPSKAQFAQAITDILVNGK